MYTFSRKFKQIYMSEKHFCMIQISSKASDQVYVKNKDFNKKGRNCQVFYEGYLSILQIATCC